MTNNEIINKYYEDIINICTKIVGRDTYYLDDLIQEVIMILLEFDNIKINKINDDSNTSLMRFTYMITKNQFNSKTSNFYRKYKRYNINKVGDMDKIDELSDIGNCDEILTRIINFVDYDEEY